jgi:transcriptional regulator with XRE-family HTH domain
VAPVIILRDTRLVRGLKETSQLRDKFGNRVRTLRAGRGFTQEQLAERAGISVDFLSLIERGKNSPSFENLDELADSLGVTVAQLFSFQEDTPEAN